ncbi:DNA polymerase thumb domain-containing protein [Texcoconibacillus texcoconensis]|uniref:DNA polymerase V n=1 Tax=Texcoconibacillus texcoconensis TaxID=1095777 RepID=A0A840QNQ2_9BACI|nr:UV damage repair protein UvrX [Texcoconibacillus texcoconensis]MBB5173005.1 DNA polymerase V [Texcoconibacillus texcoconensis]
MDRRGCEVLCVDMKSFYASCSAIGLGLDPLKDFVAVVGDQNRDGSVVLAATPAMKQTFGIRTGSRVFEIPDDSRITLVDAEMANYLNISVQVTDLFYQYVPMEAIRTYSVDESFLDSTGTYKLWGDSESLAERIRRDMYRQFGLICNIGIGPNMLLAKLSLDLEAKKTGIARWTYDDVPEKLWPVKPLQKMWGIGPRLEQRLNRMGIVRVGQLANYDVARLKKVFGVIGEQLYHHANGRDASKVGGTVMQANTSVGKGQILLRDYNDPAEVKSVILEMCEEVAARARAQNKGGQTVHLSVGYSKTAYSRGFSRQVTLAEATNVTMEIYKACLKLFSDHYDGSTVRQVTINLGHLQSDDVVQLDLFDKEKPQKRALGYTMDEIRKKHGANAILRAVSFTEAGTSRKRNLLVGGHRA